jgi:hypothetical protein
LPAKLVQWLGVELADVWRPGRRLVHAVDSQLTALLPAELNAKSNLEESKCGKRRSDLELMSGN